jgi:hypothetical protein
MLVGKIQNASHLRLVVRVPYASGGVSMYGDYRFPRLPLVPNFISKHQRETGLPLNSATVHLASLLVRSKAKLRFRAGSTGQPTAWKSGGEPGAGPAQADYRSCSFVKVLQFGKGGIDFNIPFPSFAVSSQYTSFIKSGRRLLVH